MPKASEFFSYQAARPSVGRQCRVCANEAAREAVHDVLLEAQKSGRRIVAKALGEWVARTFGVEIRPDSITGHLDNHEAQLWVEVRG